MKKVIVEIGGYFVAIDHMCTKIKLEVVEHVGKTLRNFLLYRNRFFETSCILDEIPSNCIKILNFKNVEII